VCGYCGCVVCGVCGGGGGCGVDGARRRDGVECVGCGCACDVGAVGGGVGGSGVGEGGVGVVDGGGVGVAGQGGGWELEYAVVVDVFEQSVVAGGSWVVAVGVDGGVELGGGVRGDVQDPGVG